MSVHLQPTYGCLAVSHRSMSIEIQCGGGGGPLPTSSPAADAAFVMAGTYLGALLGYLGVEVLFAILRSGA